MQCGSEVEEAPRRREIGTARPRLEAPTGHAKPPCHVGHPDADVANGDGGDRECGEAAVAKATDDGKCPREQHGRGRSAGEDGGLDARPRLIEFRQHAIRPSHTRALCVHEICRSGTCEGHIGDEGKRGSMHLNGQQRIDQESCLTIA